MYVCKNPLLTVSGAQRRLRQPRTPRQTAFYGRFGAKFPGLKARKRREVSGLSVVMRISKSILNYGVQNVWKGSS